MQYQINRNQLVKEKKLNLSTLKNISQRRSKEPFAKISLEAIENVDDDQSKRPAHLLPLRVIL